MLNNTDLSTLRSEIQVGYAEKISEGNYQDIADYINSPTRTTDANPDAQGEVNHMPSAHEIGALLTDSEWQTVMSRTWAELKATIYTANNPVEVARVKAVEEYMFINAIEAEKYTTVLVRLINDYHSSGELDRSDLYNLVYEAITLLYNAGDIGGPTGSAIQDLLSIPDPTYDSVVYIWGPSIAQNLGIGRVTPEDIQLALTTN